MNGRIETFAIKDTFYLNGTPIKLISGAFHYYRTVPEYWEDRLLKLKAMGCNAVETYVPWNLSNPREDVYDFEGILDIRAFVELAEKLELYLIFRPGPYICAEWEFGGHPAWLIKDPNMDLRTNYKPYIDAIDKYYSKLLPLVVDKQVTKGGNIIMMQLENEYGYYGSDKEYLTSLKDISTKYGIEVPFFTSDGPWNKAYLKGSLDFDEVLPTFNFGSDALNHYNNVKDDLGNRPFMCMEFWIGWFDHWGGKHAQRSPESVKKDLEDLLEVGHVNFFMFNGGTNFGFTNGANDGIHHNELQQRILQPDVTSYDYDGLLTEAGDITPKYEACKEVISKYHTIPKIRVQNTVKKAYGVLHKVNRVSLFEVLDDISEKHVMDDVVSMEMLDQNFGYILYRTKTTNLGNVTIDLVGAADRVHYFVNGTLDEIRYDTTISERKFINLNTAENKIDLLVENMGRVNFGAYMNCQHKGIRGPVLLDGNIHKGYDVYPLEMNDLSNIDFDKEDILGTPSFTKFELEISELHDTFIKLEGFGKGFVTVNGFNIGRYYYVGPQKTLYVPAPILKKGINEIIVFESDGKVVDTITLTDKHDLG